MGKSIQSWVSKLVIKNYTQGIINKSAQGIINKTTQVMNK